MHSSSHPLTRAQAVNVALCMNARTVAVAAQGSGPSLPIGYASAGVISVFEGMSERSWPNPQ